MKRIWIAALAAVIVACSSSENSNSFTGPITKPDTPAIKVPDPVVVDKSKFLVLSGENRDLASHVTNPSGATLTWASSNPSLAAVDQNGVVTGHGYGVDTVSVTPQGGSPTAVQLFVSNPVTSWDAATQGCPTPAETLFVKAAIPHIDFSGDSTTSLCNQSAGTVVMSKVKASTYRSLAALAGMRYGTISWSPSSTSLFEWLISDSKLLGIHFVGGVLGNGECCENIMTPTGLAWGVILINVDRIDTSYDSRAMASYASTFLHEARHIIFGAHKCPRNGIFVDDSLSEEGPYTATYEFTNWLSQTSLLTPSEQTREAAFAANIRKGFFCS